MAAGYDNGDIKLFDLRNMAVRWETNIKNGVCLKNFLFFSYISGMLVSDVSLYLILLIL